MVDAGPYAGVYTSWDAVPNCGKLFDEKEWQAPEIQMTAPYSPQASEERLMEIKMLYIHKIIRFGIIGFLLALGMCLSTCSVNKIFGPKVWKHEVSVPNDQVEEWHKRGYSTEWSYDDHQRLVREITLDE